MSRELGAIHLFFRIELHNSHRLLWVITLPETEVIGAIVTL
ncbi:hypothetical protein [Aeromonas veronii]